MFSTYSNTWYLIDYMNRQNIKLPILDLLSIVMSNFKKIDLYSGYFIRSKITKRPVSRRFF